MSRNANKTTTQDEITKTFKILNWFKETIITFTSWCVTSIRCLSNRTWNLWTWKIDTNRKKQHEDEDEDFLDANYESRIGLLLLNICSTDDDGYSQFVVITIRHSFPQICHAQSVIKSSQSPVSKQEICVDNFWLLKHCRDT